MSSRPSRSVRHHFICSSGVALPRWLEAFPRATVGSWSEASAGFPEATLLWLRPDPFMPALDQLNSLKNASQPAVVIVLADRPDDEEALTLFSAGIRGYCNAHSTAANLKRVAEVVQAGGLWIGETLMARLLSATSVAMAQRQVVVSSAKNDIGELSARFPQLSGREQQVAQMVAGGSSNKEIARQLAITERTVKAHIGSIFQKLDVRDRLQLALMVSGRRPG